MKDGIRSTENIHKINYNVFYKKTSLKSNEKDSQSFQIKKVS